VDLRLDAFMSRIGIRYLSKICHNPHPSKIRHDERKNINLFPILKVFSDSKGGSIIHVNTKVENYLRNTYDFS